MTNVPKVCKQRETKMTKKKRMSKRKLVLFVTFICPVAKLPSGLERTGPLLLQFGMIWQYFDICSVQPHFFSFFEESEVPHDPLRHVHPC